MYDKNRKPATPEEREYIGNAKLSGCVCCELWVKEHGGHRTGMEVEFNHHLRAGKRIGHTDGSGECLWHHRGVQLDGVSEATMRLMYGPSRAKGSKPFRAVFGDDEYLRDLTTAAVCRYFGPPAWACGASGGDR